jgi:very-short-patch-repair endonuclease
MRHTPTRAEHALWSRLRANKTGRKWRRQVPIHGYIVDFYCASLRMVVEVDGSSHRGKEKQDAMRDENLRGHRYTVVRTSNEEVLAGWMPPGVRIIQKARRRSR